MNLQDKLNILENPENYNELIEIHNERSLETILRDYETSVGWYAAYYDPKKKYLANHNVIVLDFGEKSSKDKMTYSELSLQKFKKEEYQFLQKDLMNRFELLPFNTFVNLETELDYDQKNPDAKLIHPCVNLFTDTVSDVVYYKDRNTYQIESFEKEEAKYFYAQIKIERGLNVLFKDALELFRPYEQEQLVHTRPSSKYRRLAS